MAERVAIVTTGGTIGAVITGSMTVADMRRSRLGAEFDRIRATKDLGVDVYPAFEKLSEDMAPPDWLEIIRVLDRLVGEGYKSIVVTHGTDTMAYTAAAVSLYFNNNKQGVKICLTGSFYPLNHPESDVAINLEAALEVVCSDRLTAGVYAAFRLNRNDVGVYHGLEISPISHNSLTFGAMYGMLAATYSSGRINDVRARTIDVTADCPFPSKDRLETVGRHIYQVPTYPGLNLSIFAPSFLPSDSQGRLIIIDAYHSGTASSERTNGTIIDFKRNNPKVRMGLCCVPTRYLLSPYKSTFKIMAAGVDVYTDIPPLLLYVLAVCRFGADVGFGALLDPVSPWLLNSRMDHLNDLRESMVKSAGAL